MHFSKLLFSTLSILTFVFITHAAPISSRSTKPNSSQLHSPKIHSHKASSLNAPSTNKLTVPTVEELKHRMLVPKDKALFYSSVTPFMSPNDYANAKGLKSFDLVWKDRNYPKPFLAAEQHDYLKFSKHASQAMAELASGTVHVLLPEGADNRGVLNDKPEKEPISFWGMYELPILQRSHTKIIRLDVTKVEGNGKVKEGSAREIS